jgi:hypothetical protein
MNDITTSAAGFAWASFLPEVSRRPVRLVVPSYSRIGDRC